jgi:hypothetical protein
MVYNANLGILGQREGGVGRPGTINLPVASAVAVTAGDIVNIDTGTSPDSYRTAPISGVAPFWGCSEGKAAGEVKGISGCYDGEFTTTADGAIEVGAIVVTSAATAGRVTARAAEAVNRVVGRYLFHHGEQSGTSNSPTAAAAGEKIIIKLGAEVAV